MKIPSNQDAKRVASGQLNGGSDDMADQIVREEQELAQGRPDEGSLSSSVPAENVLAAFERVASEISDTDWESVPNDLSRNVDHYLYGGTKNS